MGGGVVFRAERLMILTDIVMGFTMSGNDHLCITILISADHVTLDSVPKHVFLHLEKKVCRPIGHFCSTSFITVS